jgi:hypothetical protein
MVRHGIWQTKIYGHDIKFPIEIEHISTLTHACTYQSAWTHTNKKVNKIKLLSSNNGRVQTLTRNNAWVMRKKAGDKIYVERSCESTVKMKN